MPVKFTGYINNQGWQRPKDAFHSTSHSKEVKACSQTRLLKTLPQWGFENLSRSGKVPLYWAVLIDRSLLSITSLQLFLPWTPVKCLAVPLFIPLPLVPGLLLVTTEAVPPPSWTSPSNHSLSSKGKGPAPLSQWSLLNSVFMVSISPYTGIQNWTYQHEIQGVLSRGGQISS